MGAKAFRRLVFLALALASRSDLTNAADAPSYFAGRTVTIVDAGTPGSIYDVYAQLFARYLSRHIPGQPNVVISAMPGANGNTAAAYIARVAPKDGTYIAATYQTVPLQPILRDSNDLNYDPKRVSYLGNASSDVSLCVVGKNAPATNFADTFKTSIIMGGTAPFGPLGYLATALNKVLGTKFKQVLGYPGPPDLIAAIEKREIDGMCGISWANLVPLYADSVNSGALKVLVQVSAKGLPELNKQGIPLTDTYTRTDEQRQILDIIASQGVFARPYFVAAEVPMERLTVLRKAFIDTWNDPDLIAEASKSNLPVEPLSGEAIQSLLDGIYASSPAIIKGVREAIKVD
jgi:tripartite-type tricarboxylate transporter receptor subunit TctC